MEGRLKRRRLPNSNASHVSPCRWKGSPERLGPRDSMCHDMPACSCSGLSHEEKSGGTTKSPLSSGMLLRTETSKAKVSPLLLALVPLCRSVRASSIDLIVRGWPSAPPPYTMELSDPPCRMRSPYNSANLVRLQLWLAFHLPIRPLHGVSEEEIERRVV